MFEKSLLTINNLQQLMHADTGPNQGEDHNKKPGMVIRKQLKREKNKGGGPQNLGNRDRGRQQNRNNKLKQ